ncbi:MAG: diaminopimelate decarboxylase [Nitrospirae bacterium 13_1_20CM_2_62_14]|nr:MAG: diaminopimelate decarboxylase [Nitrospirae bacterium 13_1_40CM_4_62_6]OLC81593.1 MAG: diaminopimelate decarboxylase [Nitrospirae bacterium 13_1_40CM_3_62_11]OLD37505.1 MAG: diaminopimelate decarboxylase [Nitrospirae bacterium 13_1_40CM_2_62_10]OLE41372.1 MAG: diaminopimelate decarboxylase [Nitrospirae bacterium 13_1_20CM_2_62_14]
MHDFEYRHGELACENLPISRIAKEVGTPCYVYSYATLVRHYQVFDGAFQNVPHIVAYAVKANSNLAILRLMAREGSGADIVSGGELYRALKAGIPPSKIVFAGVGKSREEIRDALATDILMLNVESSAELRVIDEVAAEMGRRARVALRINPDIDPKTHPYISTGLKKSKFGISADRALDEYKLATSLRHIDVVGVHKHIGSQLTDIAPFVDSLKKILALVETLQRHGANIRYINIGGGLGITYSDEVPPLPHEFAVAISPLVRDLKSVLIMEPGRVIVGNAGILVTRVLYTKAGEDKHFVIVDAGMNDLIRPSLYGAYHEIRPVYEVPNAKTRTVDVVGPVCESSDFLAKDRAMPEVKAGDLLAVMSAGAYGFTMASNYNSRPRVPEVLVKGGEMHVIRTREEYGDLVRGETIPEFLR